MRRPRDASRQPRYFYGWLIIAACFTASFSEAPTRSFLLSAFVVPITEDFGWSRAALSGAVSVGAALSALLAAVAGPVVDRYGPRAVLTAAALITGTAFLLIGFVSELWQFYWLIVVSRAVGTAFVGLSITVAAANWFIRRRGRATALGRSGVSVAVPSLVLLSQFLIALYDWRLAIMVTGAITVVVATPMTLLFMRRRPEDMGLLPDGDTPHPEGGQRSRGRRVEEPRFTLRQAIRTRALWLLVVGTGLVSMTAQAVNLHALASLTDRGLPGPVAGGAITTTLVVSGIATLIWGFIVERLHIRWASSLMFLTMALGLAALAQADTVPVAYAFAVIYGVGFGGFRVVQMMLFADYFGRLRMGAILGFTRPFHVATNAAGPVLAGAAYDLQQSYVVAFSVFAAVIVLGVVAIVLARPPKLPPLEEGATA